MFNWFKKGGNRGNAELIRGNDKKETNLTRQDFNKIKPGDVLFMGDKDQPWGTDMGHAVLAVEIDQKLSTQNKVVVRVIGAYAPLTKRDESEFEMMVFEKHDNYGGNGRTVWLSSHPYTNPAQSHPHDYVLYGIGRIIKPNSGENSIDVSDIQKEAKTLDYQEYNQFGVSERKEKVPGKTRSN